MVQALYYTTAFREHVLSYPPLTPTDTPNDEYKPKVNVVVRAPAEDPTALVNGKPLTTAEALARRKQINSGQVPPGQQGIKPEDKPDTPEYKKKQAMLKGPILELAQENPGAYGMDECTFTGLRDIFMTLVESSTRTGVLSPQRFLEIFKRDNEMFRNSMHQDAHEFYGLVLNDVISNVEANARKQWEQEAKRTRDGLVKSVESALGGIVAHRVPNGVNSPGTGWVHDIFEGVLTSETKCLTCETTSQRDETFLDLSIDLEEHSSVTSCLQKFSAEEMLCERNKFYCDHCGGLQEAEKRMKLKRLPKVLALHLKRFKYTEDYSRLQKLFHRVVYPYQLRMFNTTDDAEDPDRLYELYAVIIHIGGNAYHGHYVSVIKTEDRGWLLFDDEMVEPVDKHYVRNFFGDKPGMACAYVLFYQETTFEKVRAEQEAEGLEEVRIASEEANVASQENGQPNGHGHGLTRQTTQPVSPTEDHTALANLDHAATAPEMPSLPHEVPMPPMSQVDGAGYGSLGRSDTVRGESKARREAKAREKKEAKAAEKAKKIAEKEEVKAKEKERKEREVQLREARKAEAEALKKALEESKKMATEEDEQRKKEQPAAMPPLTSPGLLNRANRGSKSMSRKSFAFLNKDKAKRDSIEVTPELPNGEQNTDANGDKQGQATPSKGRFSFGLGRKKSTNVLS
jgi:ubiquitin carboxyl-terminal hydrolase 9/13